MNCVILSPILELYAHQGVIISSSAGTNDIIYQEGRMWGLHLSVLIRPTLQSHSRDNMFIHYERRAFYVALKGLAQAEIIKNR